MWVKCPFPQTQINPTFIAVDTPFKAGLLKCRITNPHFFLTHKYLAHMFTLYVNDIPEYVDNAVDMYAHDSTLQANSKDIKIVENKLTETLAKAAEWTKNNKLTLHLGKTKAQLIGSYYISLCHQKD